MESESKTQIVRGKPKDALVMNEPHAYRYHGWSLHQRDHEAAVGSRLIRPKERSYPHCLSKGVVVASQWGGDGEER